MTKGEADGGAHRTVPAAGERSAVVGYSGQYQLAARIVHRHLPELEWIRVADPSAGSADDFQFRAGQERHAVQAKWSQYPASFSWSKLVNRQGDKPSILQQMADAWTRIRRESDGPVTIHLCTNNYASTSKPQQTSRFADASAEPPHHFAAFIARALEPVRRQLATGAGRWSDVEKLPEVTEWQGAWTAMRGASGLGNDEFAEFLVDFSLTFVPAAEPPLLRRSYDSAREVERLAAELQAIVADPARPVELTRTQFLARFGWADRLQYRNPHRFPIPSSYAANAVARTRIEDQLRTLPGGYVSLVGPAGSGKSTLLETLDLPGRVSRYFAFIPNSPNPLSGRGEADSFFNDVSLALEAGGLYRSGYPSDLAGRRTVFFEQLEQAARRYADSGVVTVMVVDGLDHIPREQNPSRSLLDELPPPSALASGVFVILGTQTTDVLPSSIQAALALDDRTIDLPPLAPGEIRQIADNSGVTSWLTARQVDDLVIASEGHPLALTYILQDLGDMEGAEDDEARLHLASGILTHASTYHGDIELRYRGYLRRVENDSDVMELLAMVSRLRSPVDLDWLGTWASRPTLQKFIESTGTFFHQSGRQWRFIHNSFRQFLADVTAQLGGAFDFSRDRKLHADLAELCATADRWTQYGDEELTHRFLAGQLAEVVATATPARLRADLTSLRPSTTTAEKAAIAARSAADLDDFPALIRTMLFVSELWQRDLVIEPKALAHTLARVAPETAVEHIVRGGALRLARVDALALAATFAESGALAAAGDIVRAAGGLAGVMDDFTASGGFSRDWAASVADWAGVTWQESGLDRVLSELDHRLPMPNADADTALLDATAEATGLENDVDVAGDVDIEDEVAQQRVWARQRAIREASERSTAIRSARTLAHTRCFDRTAHIRDAAAMNRIEGIIDAEASVGWRARARVVRALAALEDGKLSDVLLSVRDLLALEAFAASPDDEDGEEQLSGGASTIPPAIPLGLRLQAAETLIRAGMGDEPELAALLPAGMGVRWPQSYATDSGLEPYRTFIDFHRVRGVFPDPSGGLPSDVSETTEPARRRFETALVILAALEASALSATISDGAPPAIAAHADAILRLLEVPSAQTQRWTSWYTVRSAAPELFARLVRLAASAEGGDGLRRLLAMFEAAWTDPERLPYWPITLQQSVITAAADTNAVDLDWAFAQLSRIDAEIDEGVDGPHARVEALLKQAEAWETLDEDERALESARRAVQEGWGPGQHDDDTQLVGWLEWIPIAARYGAISTSDLPTEYREYASRLTNSADASQHYAEAAETLIADLFPIDATLACAIADTLCEQGIIDETASFEAIALGAARAAEVSPHLAAAVFTNMVMPLVPAASPAIATALLERDADGSIAAEIDAADECWTLREPDTESSEETTSSRTVAGDDHTVPSPPSAGALLAEMRATAPPAGHVVVRAWEGAVDSPLFRTDTAVATALLVETTRLRLTGTIAGALVALAARSGAVPAAEKALTDVLARTPAYGWLRRYDGGTRLTLFDAALKDRDANLLRVAARDLANTFGAGVVNGLIQPRDVLRIVQLLGGGELVAATWSDVRALLDVYAPVGSAIPATAPEPSSSATAALLRWAGGHLGHPVRAIDFGARAVLQIAADAYPAEAHTVIAEAIGEGGWRAEAALLALATASPAPTNLSSDLQEAIGRACADLDGIIRSIAVRLAAEHRVDPLTPPARPLPEAYRLALPELPARSVAPRDRRGVPHIDVHDPQQIVAPFDLPIEWIARMAGLDEAAVIHRAATFARAADEPWTAGGHRAQAARLRRRGELQTYRPWAYMAGRRALAAVLGELVDASQIAFATPYPAYELGLVDEITVHIAISPLDSSTPLPWRPEDASVYDAFEWCTETSDAAAAYADGTQSSPYILAELGQWMSLAWGTPTERRTIQAHHLHTSSLAPALPNWESTYECAMWYPRLDLSWSNRELVVHGQDLASDGRWQEWIAMHPIAAEHLGWQPGSERDFEWVGSDGQWRARTVLRVRGQLGQRPPMQTYVAHVWQVEVSGVAEAELIAAFPDLGRTLRVERVLKPDGESGGGARQRVDVELTRYP